MRKDWEWRARIAANLKLASSQKVRALFSEMNPHLVGDKLFETRWTRERQDAAVLIPIFDRPAGPTVLLTVRSADTPSHAGQICFPGGRVQADDGNSTITALRETEEEVGIARELVDVIGALGAHQGGLGFSVTPVVGVVDAKAAIHPAPREVAEAFEVPLSFISDLANHSVEQREEQGVAFNIFSIRHQGFHIWGLTAGILRSLAEILQDEPFGPGRR
ncbi:MAG: CoA pyrophosphatase [Parvularculaceae bacterium]